MNTISYLHVAFLLLCSTATSSHAQDDWVPLFDGKSLEGWTQRNGTATYRVEDGMIVGRTTPGSPNSFLCTDRSYGDFELRFEVRVDPQLNSGVQIRSRTKNGLPDGRVNGPQVEIEASGRNGAEAGYLYGEAAGGWMTPRDQLVPHKHFKDSEWNAYRVIADGARIKVWINDVLISDLVDVTKYETHPHGFIGLQVHGVGNRGPFEVAWRNLFIREHSSGRDRDGWVDLLEGGDLSQWNTTGNWQIQPNGVLVIDPRENEKGWQRFDAYLWSKRTYADFVFDVEYAYPKGGNSGVFFRVGDPKNPVATGIEAQILDSTGHDGEMSHHDHGGIISTAGASKNMSLPPGSWNRMRITCRGAHLTVVLNDERIHDLDLANSAVKDRPLEGYVGLQDHGSPNRIAFRNVRIKELLPEVEPLEAPLALWNGKDLTGWVADVPAKDGNPDAPESFAVRDGNLVSLGNPEGHLVTERVFRDYRLTVEYRFPGKGGNCGVLVHASRPRALYKMFPASIEVQMHHRNAGDFWCIQEDIAVPDMETRRKRGPNQKWGGAEGDSRRILNLTDDSEKPLGTWNQMVIECRDRTITVHVNGDLVNQGFDCTKDRGKIALQAEGTEVEFRRVELTPLESK